MRDIKSYLDSQHHDRKHSYSKNGAQTSGEHPKVTKQKSYKNTSVVIDKKKKGEERRRGEKEGERLYGEEGEEGE